MKTPQFTKKTPSQTTSSDYSLGFTKSQLAKFYFGTKQWNIDIDIIVPGAAANTWKRTFVVRSGEIWTSYEGDSSSPSTEPYSNAEQSVTPYGMNRTANYNIIGSTRPGDIFDLSNILFVKSNLYYPVLYIVTAGAVLGSARHLTTIKNSYFSSTPATGVIFTFDGITYPMWQSDNSSLLYTGTVSVASIPW